MKKRMLITGISGQLGSNLAYCLKNEYDILGVYHTNKFEMDGIQTTQVDLAYDREVSGLIEDFKPDVVVHCAAQADVDICEVSREEAERTNVLGTRNLVNNLKNSNSKFITISTDLIYDGVKGDFSEEDEVNPLNFYGFTKQKAELEALKKKGSLVFRTNFFGWNVNDKRYSLGEWVINELSKSHEIQGFSDCTFSSIYTIEMAKILKSAIEKDLSGTYNCASSSSMSKYDFVMEIARALDFDEKLIKAISIDEFNFVAKRGKNLSLDVSKLAKDLNMDIPSIAESIDCFIEDFKRGIPAEIKSDGVTKHYYPDSMNIIPYGRQSIDEEDMEAVIKVLKSRTITQGPIINEFESALCRVTGASSAIAVNSGTSALHIACLAAGIGTGDEVITSPNSFVASANCVVYCGGKPIFVDIDPKTYNVLPSEIEKKINKRTKAVICVHFAGQSCDMEEIAHIVRTAEKKYGHKIYVIEDACHALGSCYKDTLVGSCAHSDMATMSFHPVKHITTGEGGCVLTNDEELKHKLGYLRSHGITSDVDSFEYSDNAFEYDYSDGEELVKKPWYYEQNCLGYNYRITELQCALGVSQLKKLDLFRDKRRKIVDQYNKAFKDIEYVTTPFESQSCKSNFHLYVLLFDFERIGLSRSKFIMKLRENHIQTQVHYIPIHTQPYYRKNFGTNWGDCSNTEQYYRQCLSIPLYPGMKNKDIKTVVTKIKELIKNPMSVKG